MIKFSAPQLIDMLTLQNRLNVLRHGPLWREKHYEWHRAAWIECAGLIEHIGWKWWAHQKPSLVEAQLHLIKVWHTCLCYALEATHAQLGSDDVYLVADSIRNDMALAETSLTFGFKAQVNLHGEIPALLNLVELLVSQCANDQQVSPAITLELGEVLGLDADTLYHMHIGHTMMVLFRDEYGERKGVYHRRWDGELDETVMVNIMKENPDWGSTRVYDEMRVRYGRPVPEAANDGS
jgi:hypothetical protein